MSAFDRPAPGDLSIESQRRWWAETCAKRDDNRRERMQRGALKPWVADRDARYEAAIARSLAELDRRTAIASRTAPGSKDGDV